MPRAHCGVVGREVGWEGPFITVTRGLQLGWWQREKRPPKGLKIKCLGLEARLFTPTHNTRARTGLLAPPNHKKARKYCHPVGRTETIGQTARDGAKGKECAFKAKKTWAAVLTLSLPGRVTFSRFSNSVSLGVLIWKVRRSYLPGDVH